MNWLKAAPWRKYCELPFRQIWIHLLGQFFTHAEIIFAEDVIPEGFAVDESQGLIEVASWFEGWPCAGFQT